MTDVPKKKRLPVLQEREPDEEMPPEERPPSHWVVATAVITLLAWLLLAGSVNLLMQRIAVRAAPLLIAVNVVVLFLSGAVAGAVAAKLGKKAERKHAVQGAAYGAGFGALFGLSQGTGGVALPFWILSLVVLVGIASGGASVGYRVMVRVTAAKTARS